MNLKKMIIGISLVLSLSCTAAYASKIPFCDVTEQTPYYTAIDRLYDMGVIRGYEDGTSGQMIKYPLQRVLRLRKICLVTLLPCPINGRIGFLQNAVGTIISI